VLRVTTVTSKNEKKGNNVTATYIEFLHYPILLGEIIAFYRLGVKDSYNEIIKT
jgi:hypothetical protein